MQIFWNKLNRNLTIEIFDYDFTFSISDYFLISSSSYFPFSFPDGESEKRADIPMVWHFLNFLIHQGICLFSFKEDIADFYEKFLSKISPLVFNKVEDFFLIGVRKYQREIYDYVYFNKNVFNKGVHRFMWLVYKDKFDKEFLMKYLNNPLFLSWYIKNLETDSKEKTLEKELDMFITNPAFFEEMKKKGLISSLRDSEEKNDFIDTIRKMAELHKESLIGGNKLKKSHE